MPTLKRNGLVVSWPLSENFGAFFFCFNNLTSDLACWDLKDTLHLVESDGYCWGLLHSFESRDCQIWNEAFIDVRLKDFIKDRTTLPGKPRRRKTRFYWSSTITSGTYLNREEMDFPTIQSDWLTEGIVLHKLFSVPLSQQQVNSKMIHIFDFTE